MPLSAACTVDSTPEEPPEKKKKLLDPASLSSSSSSLLLLPDAIVVSCFARVPRCYYPAISLVSRTFRRLIASPEIYVERSVIRRTEKVIYVAIRSNASEPRRWYTLNLKPRGNRFAARRTETSQRLVPVPSFPSIPDSGAFIVTAGSEIYVVGGCVNGGPVSTVFVIDCPSHTCRFLPSVKEPRNCASGGFIDGKLYVVGGCNPLSLNWIEAFDLKRQNWESVLVDVNNVELREGMVRSFVMNDKIYFLGRKASFVYDPKQVGLRLRLHSSIPSYQSVKEDSCVVDKMLLPFNNYHMVLFNPVKDWGVLLQRKDRPEGFEGSLVVNCSGRLVILFNPKKCPTEIWCAEFPLERREGEIQVWFLRSNHVLTLAESSIIEKSFAVTF